MNTIERISTLNKDVFETSIESIPRTVCSTDILNQNRMLNTAKSTINESNQ